MFFARLFSLGRQQFCFNISNFLGVILEKKLAGVFYLGLLSERSIYQPFFAGTLFLNRQNDWLGLLFPYSTMGKNVFLVMSLAGTEKFKNCAIPKNWYVYEENC